MSELALFGGKPVRSTPFPAYKTLGEEEKAAAVRVVSAGVLSDFIGRDGPRFGGGAEVHALEAEWASRFAVKHAVSVNSATSGLYAALGAVGLEPGDEVVVSPYTMSASAAGAFVYGAKPVFADIDPETFCITAKTIEPVLTKRTRAILAVDLFGHPIDATPMMELAKRHGLLVIEDAAQAAGSTYHGKAAGTLGHMGVFSLNVHKIIQAGEGGIVVTDDDRLAERLRLVRNHGEVVVRDRKITENADIVGFNYRMTELEAAVSREQLKKLDRFAAGWTENSECLQKALSDLPGLRPARLAEGCTSVYYQLAVHYDATAMGVHRDVFIDAMRAEGVPLGQGYVEPLYYQPLYEKRHPGDPAYRRGACPIAESMWSERLINMSLIHASMTRKDLEDVAAAFHKVVEHRRELLA